MNWKNIGLMFAAMTLLGLSAACDNSTNSNDNANTVNRNANAAKANEGTPTPTPTANSNNSNSNPSKSDVQKDADKYKQQAKDMGRKIGDGAEDAWLWVKTRSTLAAADDLRDSTINVDVDNNAVTLSGSVSNASQKTKAEQLTKEVDGVKSVKNELRVAADSSPNATSDKKAPAPAKK
jgi:hypothetical protein